jgi:hypothetical protein
MAVDMVYDILKRHNPMLACVTEGHDVLECSRMNQGLDLMHYTDSPGYKFPNTRRVAYQNYHMNHSQGKISNNHFHPHKAKLIRPPEPLSIPNRERRKIIEKQKYSSLYQ